MKQEIEVRFLDVDHDALRAKLTTVGATCEQPLRLMRRAIIDYPDRRMQTTSDTGWGWVRVRDEGNKITCTYKHIAKDGNDTTHEIEYEVSSYEKAIELFEAIGLVKHSEQETKRENWRLGAVEIMLDEWPWIPPYIEIEGEDEASIRRVAKILGFDWSEVFRRSPDWVYRLYYPKMGPEESVADIQQLTFAGAMPPLLRDRK